MRHFRKIAVLIFCLVLFQAQGSKKDGKDENIDVAKYKGHKVVVGTENGSLRDETIILNSGQVYSHKKAENEYKFMKKLKRSEVNHIFSILGRAPISSFNHPGDNSLFIEAYNSGGVTNYYIWGEQGVKVPDYILEDYTEIIKIVR